MPVIDTAFEKIRGDSGELSENERGKMNEISDRYACNNITADFRQVGEQILSTSSRINGNGQFRILSAFKHMLLDGHFDLVLNIEGGPGGGDKGLM